MCYSPSPADPSNLSRNTSASHRGKSLIMLPPSSIPEQPEIGQNHRLDARSFRKIAKGSDSVATVAARSPDVWPCGDRRSAWRSGPRFGGGPTVASLGKVFAKGTDVRRIPDQPTNPPSLV